MLTVQYRMHRAIMTWSSHELYHDKLVADGSVSGHLLTDLPAWRPATDGSVDVECLEAPIVLIDTAGCGLEELQDASSLSKANPGEAHIVVAHVRALIASGLRQQEV
jgi:ATP-dependent RNA/DNA helicase IGHMBP2